MKQRKSLMIYFAILAIYENALAQNLDSSCSQFTSTVGSGLTTSPFSTFLPQTSPPLSYLGQGFMGGYFTLQLISSDTNFAYYQLYFNYFVQRSLTSAQTCCDAKIIFEMTQIGFPFNLPEFAINCNSGCTSSSNSSILGYMGGSCNTYSVDESFTVITSTYSLVGNLNSQSFEVTNLPEVTNVIDWIPLSVYFNNLSGYRYRLYNSMLKREESNSLNNPPLVLIDPIITLYYNLNSWISIPVFDIDEDLIICNIYNFEIYL